jgi:hypothetical protein
MFSLVTSTWRRLHVTGSTTLRLHRFLLPLFALALAPGVMGSLSYPHAAVGVPSARHTASVAIGSGSGVSQTFYYHPASDVNGGPPVL